MRNTFAKTIEAVCGEREDVFVLTGDAGLGVWDDFRVRYADRFVNTGVAEQNAIGMAAGLALAGWKVCVYNIVPFVLYRCYEQVRDDVCYQRLPVVLAGIGSGVAYAPAGMTHYAVEDLGVARTLPNLTVLSPIDPVEGAAAARHALAADGPVYVRLAKRGEPRLRSEGVEAVDVTRPCRLREGGDVALVFHGSIGAEVLAAAELLGTEGIGARVVSVTQVQPLAAEAIVRCVEGVSWVVTVEEHFAGCGMGSALAAWWAVERPGPRLAVLGIRDGFIHAVRDHAGMRAHYGLSAAGIAEQVKRIIEGNQKGGVLNPKH